MNPHPKELLHHELTYKIIGILYKVHSAIGPGFDFLYNLDYNNVDRLSLIKGRKFIILSLKEGQIWFQKIS